ncbi:unnamed protein product, partial [Phaeothamnion confervicola]
LIDLGDRFHEASALLSQAMLIYEKAFGYSSDEVARDLSDLALALCLQGRYDEAEPLLRRALRIDRARLGPRHPDVLADLSNLAVLLGERGRLHEAESLLRRCVADAEALLPADSTQLALWRGNLARVL